MRSYQSSLDKISAITSNVRRVTELLLVLWYGLSKALSPVIVDAGRCHARHTFPALWRRQKSSYPSRALDLCIVLPLVQDTSIILASALYHTRHAAASLKEPNADFVPLMQIIDF